MAQSSRPFFSAIIENKHTTAHHKEERQRRTHFLELIEEEQDGDEGLQGSDV